MHCLTFQTNPRMYLVPRGICRVRWDPLPPSGDRDLSIGAFSLMGLRGRYEITPKSESPMKMAKHRTAACPSTWVPVGPINSYHILQGDILICLGAFSRGHIDIFDCFRDVPSRKSTQNHSNRTETGPNDPVPCSILQRVSFQ